MDVDLLSRRNFIRRAEMQQMPRPAALRKVAGVLDERIQRFCELPIQEESRLSGKITCRLLFARLSQPIHRELPGGGPIGRELVRPRQLQPRIISMARHRACSRGKAQESDYGYVKSPSVGPSCCFMPSVTSPKPDPGPAAEGTS